MLNIITWIVFFRFNSSKNFIAHHGNNSSILSVANDRIWLSWSSLTIGKQARIEALESIIKHLFTLPLNEWLNELTRSL